MSTKHYCDRCNAELMCGMTGTIYEHFHPIPAETPKFRISIEFYQQFSTNKAELCRACMVQLAKEKVEALRA